MAGPERGRICGYGRSGPVRDAGAGAVCAGTPGVCKKQQLDVFATELVREAEISGRVGAETDRREESLIEKTGLEPDISWSQEGRIQLNKDVSVTLTYETNIGLFGKFGSFPVTLRAEASGKSEVYWK